MRIAEHLQSISVSLNIQFCYRFATQQRDALLFYNGRFNERHDFIALEIVDGQIQFSFSLGANITKVSPYIIGGVNDGKWHQVTVAYLNRVSKSCVQQILANNAVKILFRN